MRKPNILTVSLTIVLVFATVLLTSCAVSPEQARGELTKLNTNYTNINDFLNYTQKDDLAVVTLFLQAGADANLTNSDKETALMIAADKSYPEICKLLLDQGADLNARDSQDRTALGIATSRGKSEIVKLLLDRGADANSKNKGVPLLVTAIQQGKADIAKVLLNKGADIDAKGSDADTLLTLAIANNQLETVKLLLKAGVNVNVKVGKNNETALTRAAYQADIDILKELLNAGAEVKT
ncbi:MAG: ankyrin repeat domain-containing protein, partial [Desulfitobacteriaceae bacterium]